jgi:hypothetical protein
MASAVLAASAVTGASTGVLLQADRTQTALLARRKFLKVHFMCSLIR